MIKRLNFTTVIASNIFERLSVFKKQLNEFGSVRNLKTGFHLIGQRIIYSGLTKPGLSLSTSYF
jgi:hypothetical protein